MYDDCPSLHAEANALMRSDHSARVGGSIYVTSHVCFGCAKLIANSGLVRVVVDTDKADAHRNPIASYQFLLQCGIQVQLSDLVMQARLDNRPLMSVRGYTAPPFPGGTLGALHKPETAVYTMTYEERVAKELVERQDPRR